MKITMPTTIQGRPNEEKKENRKIEVQLFCEKIIEVESSLDFPVSSRGWCYLLEEYGLNKGDFDRAETLINNCRKSGLLPLELCGQDGTRRATGIDTIDKEKEEYFNHRIDSIKKSMSKYYNPFFFSDYQEKYIELLVEKIDLKGIFKPLCEKYHIPYANSKGWADINGRADMMQRFKVWEESGKQCVLLYCGDHDPGGLHISDKIIKNLKDLENAADWNPDNLIIDRFGLNYDFIEENKLTWIENLITSSNKDLASPKHLDHFKPYVQDYIKKYGARKVEANALITRIEAGRELCEQAILKYIDLDDVKKYEEETAKEREVLQATIDSKNWDLL